MPSPRLPHLRRAGPDTAVCYYNRTLAYDALGQTDRAFHHVCRAIALDPNLTAALLNRGILLFKSGRSWEAITDFQQALRTASDPETLGRIHFNLALAHLAQGDRPSALADAENATAQGCQEARRLRESLLHDRR
jgi:eukaryotic-like serine/threonine-protein kinase